MPTTMLTEVKAFDSEILDSTGSGFEVLERLTVNGPGLSDVTLVNGAGVLMLIQVPLSTYSWQYSHALGITDVQQV